MTVLDNACYEPLSSNLDKTCGIAVPGRPAAVRIASGGDDAGLRAR